MNRLQLLAGMLLIGALPGTARAQITPPDVSGPDSVNLVAGAQYRAGALHRFFFGGTYRNLWITPIRVPILNLRTFAGGLTPDKEGGGFETKSLRFRTADGAEYVFRSVNKVHGPLSTGFADVKLAGAIAQDATSSSHPAANVIVGVLLDAAGVLHDAPVMVAMPDDSLLGKFRKKFANHLGLFARYPTNSHGDARNFANAIDIIDSDTLRARMDRDPAERVDAPAFLAARLIDMLVNNWDRHKGQWKWARLEPRGSWEPISRDYDKAFISAGGFLPGMVRQLLPNLVTFDSTYSSMRALTFNSLEFDGRLLAGLSKPAWDSVAQAVQRRITDGVISAAMHAMPAEYLPSDRSLEAKLRFRRDSLVVEADRFYRYLAGVVDIHATDAADRATIRRIDDRFVDVRLESADSMVYFARRFDARETTAIRIYLHGGDDEATVAGGASDGMSVRIIGGNGTNHLVDSAAASGRHHGARLYDNGVVSGVRYTPDTLFDRRPLVNIFGHWIEPAPDHGTVAKPVVDLALNHDVGIMPTLGITWRHYGFRDQPYANSISLTGSYSTLIGGFRAAISADQRRESSTLHFTELAQASQLELVNYHGLGNSSPESPGLIANVTAPRTDYYAVSQLQWLFQPAIARGIGTFTQVTLGPVFKYSVTDSTPDRFVSATRPYGFASFGEAGLRLALSHNGRSPLVHPRSGTMLDLSGTYFPAMWDVRSSFGVVSATGAVYLTVPVLSHPWLGFRGGVKKVFGDFPFQESAFIGGRADVRTLDLQRYAGDASVYATAEIHVPVAKFTIVVPWNAGLLATGDIGRVYVNGDSPGGWHNAFGAGFWIGIHELTVDVRVMHAYEVGRPAVVVLQLVLPGGFQ